MPYSQSMKPVPKKSAMQKVTVMLPRDLVEKAKRASGLGLTPTIRQGLEKVVRSDAYEALRRLRGTEPFSMTWQELRGK
jgi:hypothetical protein